MTFLDNQRRGARNRLLWRIACLASTSRNEGLIFSGHLNNELKS